MQSSQYRFALQVRASVVLRQSHNSPPKMHRWLLKHVVSHAVIFLGRVWSALIRGNASSPCGVAVMAVCGSSTGAFRVGGDAGCGGGQEKGRAEQSIAECAHCCRIAASAVSRSLRLDGRNIVPFVLRVKDGILVWVEFAGFAASARSDGLREPAAHGVAFTPITLRRRRGACRDFRAAPCADEHRHVRGGGGDADPPYADLWHHPLTAARHHPHHPALPAFRISR